MGRARLPSLAKGLIQFECCADTTVQRRGRNAPGSGIPLLLGEAIEKRNECLFAGELGCGLRFEIGTVDLDPKLFWSRWIPISTTVDAHGSGSGSQPC